MTAYANQKALLLNRLLRTEWDVTVDVSPGAGAITTALAAIADAAVDKRYRILCADGNYTETAVIDFSAAGKRYIDLCGSGPRNAGDTAGVSITNSQASTDVIKMGGCDNMLSGLKVVQAAGSGTGYAVHYDGNPLGTVQTSIIYNCKLSSTRAPAVGIGMYGKQRLYIVDCPQVETTLNAITGHGIYMHDWYPAMDSTGNSKLAIIGSVVTGTRSGLFMFPNGCVGHSQVLLSGNTFTAATANFGDLIFGAVPFVIGTTAIPKQDGTTTGYTWSGSDDAAQLLNLQGVYNGKPWWYDDFSDGQTPNVGTYTANDPALWTLYWSASLSAWVLYRSDADSTGGATPHATRPDLFEAGLAAGTDYFYWPMETGWDSPLAQAGLAHGTNFAGKPVPSLDVSKGNASGYGFAGNMLVWLDGANAAAVSGGQNGLAHYGATASSLTDVKDTGYVVNDSVKVANNGLLLALSWLDEIDPAYPAASDVVSGVDRGDGVLGTGKMPSFGPYPAGVSALGPFPVSENAIGPYQAN